MVVNIGQVDCSDQGKLREAENLALRPWRGGLRGFVRFVHIFRVLSMEVTWSAQSDIPAANARIRPSCKLAPITVNNERSGSEVPRKICVSQAGGARLLPRHGIVESCPARTEKELPQKHAPARPVTCPLQPDPAACAHPRAADHLA